MRCCVNHPEALSSHLCSIRTVARLHTCRTVQVRRFSPLAFRNCHGGLQRCLHHTKLQAASGDREDVDVAVFRFTLGIPGFDDGLIPRVVGGLGALLLAVNHILGEAPAAQERTELISAALCAVLLVAPWLEDRLREARPGRGRSAAGDVPGAKNCFQLAPRLDDAVKKELAWASYALLLNTNCCGFILADSSGRPLCVRGALGAEVVASSPEATLSNINQALAQLLKPGLPVAELLSCVDKSQIYAADKAGMSQLKTGSCDAIAEGVECVLFQRLGGPHPGSQQNGLLILLSERERGLSERDCLWAEAIALKLAGVLTASVAPASKA